MKKLCLILLAAVVVFCTACDQTAVQTNTPAPPTEPEEYRVSFYGVGDNLIHDSVYWRASEYAGADGYNFLPMYEYVAKDIASADLAYINQETLLGGTALGLSSYPRFNSPQECGRDMLTLGFDIFSLATNHVFDMGEPGLENTYAFFSDHPSATAIGLYKKEEQPFKIVEKNNIKIAFLNYTHPTNGLSLPHNSAYTVPLADYKDGCVQMCADVQKAKAQADFVVCCMHWGEEYQNTPNTAQRTMAQALADAGCDVILGTHPHMVQPVEHIGNTLVVYSLGNFISAQKASVSQVGGAIRFEFVKKGADTYIENISFDPLINHYNPGFRNIRIIPFAQYTPQMASMHGAGVSYNYLENLIQKTMTIDGELQ